MVRIDLLSYFYCAMKSTLLIISLFLSFRGFSQQIDPTEKSLNRTLHLTLGLDVGLKQLRGDYLDHYEGEYLPHDTSGTNYDLVWIDSTIKTSDLPKNYKMRSYQLSSMLQFSKHWS